MPIDIEDIRKPKWVKIRDRYPTSYDKKDRYNEVFPLANADRYRGNVGREGGWKFPGYNPNNNTTKLYSGDIRNENITIRPY